MANDNHASFFKLGFTIIIGLLAAAGALVYLGGMRSSEELFVETCYDRAVDGLSVGSTVNFRGVKIGEVRELGFIGDHYAVSGADNPRIYILLALDRKLLGFKKAGNVDFTTRIAHLVNERGMRATVSASGITGLSHIELDFNLKDPPPPPKISWEPDHPYIPPKYSLLDSFSDSATKVMNQINQMDLSAAWSNINASVESLSRAMSSAETVIETRQADLERLLEDVSATAASIRELAEELKRNPSLLIRERVAEPLEETR